MAGELVRIVVKKEVLKYWYCLIQFDRSRCVWQEFMQGNFFWYLGTFQSYWWTWEERPTVVVGRTVVT